MSQDALASELAPQGRKVFVPKYGVRNLTQFRKRAWTLLCEAFKYPKAYPRLSRRDREDPSRPVASTDRDAPASRQIHAQRREAVELNILAWLSTVVSLTTWEVTVKDREAIDALGMGKRRIQRGLKDVETRGFITLRFHHSKEVCERLLDDQSRDVIMGLTRARWPGAWRDARDLGQGAIPGAQSKGRGMS